MMRRKHKAKQIKSYASQKSLNRTFDNEKDEDMKNMTIWLPNCYEKMLVGLLEPDSETDICLQQFTESQNF